MSSALCLKYIGQMLFENVNLFIDYINALFLLTICHVCFCFTVHSSVLLYRCKTASFTLFLLRHTTVL